MPTSEIPAKIEIPFLFTTLATIGKNVEIVNRIMKAYESFFCESIVKLIGVKEWSKNIV